MKYLASLLCLLFVPLSASADQPERKVIKPPQVVRSQPRNFTRPPTARPTIPGKQQWQKPQPQPQPQQPRVETKHSFGFYNYYRPVNPHFRYYRVPSYYPPVIIQPPVVIQPQPMPVYPGPFHGFFFQFRW
tara:strand:+ start:411 stop:803 length:393 start_codon:yes stop_codon:yes gene_type:complete